MEHTYSYNQKKCATCEYWGGSREVNSRQRSHL